MNQGQQFKHYVWIVNKLRQRGRLTLKTLQELWVQDEVAEGIGVPASQLNELLNAKRSLSAEMALLIGQALGLDPAPLLALQTDYNLLSAKRNKSFLERLKDIPRIAAIF